MFVTLKTSDKLSSTFIILLTKSLLAANEDSISFKNNFFFVFLKFEY